MFPWKFDENLLDGRCANMSRKPGMHKSGLIEILSVEVSVQRTPSETQRKLNRIVVAGDIKNLCFDKLSMTRFFKVAVMLRLMLRQAHASTSSA